MLDSAWKQYRLGSAIKQKYSIPQHLLKML